MKIRPNSGKAVRHPRRTERRERANARQAERDKLTPTQQIKELSTRPGHSLKEVARLKEAMK